MELGIIRIEVFGLDELFKRERRQRGRREERKEGRGSGEGTGKNFKC